MWQIAGSKMVSRLLIPSHSSDYMACVYAINILSFYMVYYTRVFLQKIRIVHVYVYYETWQLCFCFKGLISLKKNQILA